MPFSNIEQNWTKLNKVEQCWTKLDKVEKSWKKLKKVEQSLTKFLKGWKMWRNIGEKLKKNVDQC